MRGSDCERSRKCGRHAPASGRFGCWRAVPQGGVVGFSPLGKERVGPIRRILDGTDTRPPSLTGQAGPGERPSPKTAHPPPQRMGGPLPSLGSGSFGPSVRCRQPSPLPLNPLGDSGGVGREPPPPPILDRRGGRCSWPHSGGMRTNRPAGGGPGVYGRRRTVSNRRSSRAKEPDPPACPRWRGRSASAGAGSGTSAPCWWAPRAHARSASRNDRPATPPRSRRCPVVINADVGTCHRDLLESGKCWP